MFGLLKVFCLRNYPTGCLRYDTPDTMHFMSEQRMPMLQNTGTTQLSTFLRVSPLQSALLFLVVLGGCNNLSFQRVLLLPRFRNTPPPLFPESFPTPTLGQRRSVCGKGDRHFPCGIARMVRLTTRRWVMFFEGPPFAATLCVTS